MPFESPTVPIFLRHRSVPLVRARLLSRFVLLGLLFISMVGCRPDGAESGRSESGKVPDSATADPGSDDGPVTDEPEPLARKVEVETVRLGAVRDTITLSTTLEARRTVEIPARIAGRVDQVLVRPGTLVVEGESLLRIEIDELQLAVVEQSLAHADAVERAATAELDWQDSGANEELRQLSADKAKREFQRLEGLTSESGRKAVSEEDVEATRFAWQEARIALASALLATRRADHSRRLAEIAVERAQVAWDRARLDLERADIRAPIAGAVTFLDVRPGEQVAAGLHVATVVDAGELFCAIRVPQRRLAELELGLRVEIEAETHPGRVFGGTLEAIVPVVNPSEGTIEARVKVNDPTGSLRPGAFLSARVILSERPDALLVPKRARLFDGNVSYLFVVREDRAVKIPVLTGLLTTDEVEILPASSQLMSVGVGEAVVTRCQSRLRDGERVETTEGESLPVPAEAPEAKSTSALEAPPRDGDSAPDEVRRG